MGLRRKGVIMDNDKIRLKRLELEGLIQGAAGTFILSDALKKYRKELKELQSSCSHDGMEKNQKGVCFYCGKVIK